MHNAETTIGDDFGNENRLKCINYVQIGWVVFGNCSDGNRDLTDQSKMNREWPVNCGVQWTASNRIPELAIPMQGECGVWWMKVIGNQQSKSLSICAVFCGVFIKNTTSVTINSSWWFLIDQCTQLSPRLEAVADVIRFIWTIFCFVTVEDKTVVAPTTWRTQAHNRRIHVAAKIDETEYNKDYS